MTAVLLVPETAAAESPGLPQARGPLSSQLIAALAGPPAVFWPDRAVGADPLRDEDLQLTLYLCYELHYKGLPGVDDAWEWHPSVTALAARLERSFEGALRDELPRRSGSRDEVVARLWSMTEGNGESFSQWLLDHGSYEQAQEVAAHRSAYQLKEADPHTWAIPRLSGRAKAAMVKIQHDEYGEGSAPRMHASLFATTMRELGLDATYGAYVDRLPATTLATTNLITMLGLHRRLRGALVGHLALFEMTSVGPMGRYAAWLRRLGVGAGGREFYDVHVVADAVHQHIAADDLVGGLLDDEPQLASDVLFGAEAVSLLEARFVAHLRACWDAGRSSLLDCQPISRIG